jgi:hypothetical protein
MHGVASESLSYSYSSSEPSAPDSVPASPLPISDLVISSTMIVTGSELPMIPEMPELDSSQYTLEPEETRPHAGTSASMLLTDLLFVFGSH